MTVLAGTMIVGLITVIALLVKKSDLYKAFVNFHKDMQASEVKIWNRMDGKTSPISSGAVTFNGDNY